MNFDLNPNMTTRPQIRLARTTKPCSNPELGELVADHLVGLLAEDAESRLQEHIGVCPSCQVVIMNWQSFKQAFKETVGNKQGGRV